MQPLFVTSDITSASPSDTLLIVSPVRNYTQEESDSVYSFLQMGGRVVVVEDFGNANSLLKNINSPITVNPVPLCEYENYHVNHSFPIIKKFNPSAETANVSQLILNHPASLNVSGNAYTLAQTSGHGWLDVDDSGMMNGQEKMGTYTVVARADYGTGQLLVISDPDIFINSMIDLGDNQAFMNNIFQGKVWVDVAHGRGLTLIGAIFFAAKYDYRVQISIILLMLTVSYAYLQRRGILNYLRGLVTRWPGQR
jgi:hypothetical protein